MIDNTRVHRCVCKVKGLAHVFTAASTKPYIILVDQRCARLLRDVTWCVSPAHAKSKLLRARAGTSAPGIKVGRQLHQLVMRIRRKGRRVWALNRNYLDVRRSNLRSMSFADTRILSTVRPSTQAVGVTRPSQPSFFKTLLRPYQMRIRVAGKDLSLWFTTLETAQAAYDAAAIKVRGPTATTNQSLGLLSTDVARTKLCRNAAKMARRLVREHWSGELLKRYEAMRNAKTHAEKVAILKGLREEGRPAPAVCGGTGEPTSCSGMAQRLRCSMPSGMCAAKMLSRSP